MKRHDFAKSRLQRSRFSPLDYNPLIWYCAWKEAYEDSEAVASLTDFSGRGFHATQGTPSKQPAFTANILNSHPVIRCDGGDTMTIGAIAALNGATALTTYTVAKLQAATAQWIMQFKQTGGIANNRMTGHQMDGASNEYFYADGRGSFAGAGGGRFLSARPCSMGV